MQNVITEAKVRLKEATWKVKFTDVSTTTIHGGAQNYKQPVLTDAFISLYASFQEPGDSISYKIQVTNEGSLKAAVANITVLSNLIDLVDFEYTDITVGDVLDPSQRKFFNVKITYNPKKSIVKSKEDKIVLVINWKQAN